MRSSGSSSSTLAARRRLTVMAAPPSASCLRAPPLPHPSSDRTQRGRDQHQCGPADAGERRGPEQAEREQKTREWVAQGKTVEDLLREFGRI